MSLLSDDLTRARWGLVNENDPICCKWRPQSMRVMTFRFFGLSEAPGVSLFGRPQGCEAPRARYPLKGVLER